MTQCDLPISDRPTPAGAPADAPASGPATGLERKVDFAARCGVHKGTISKWINDGRIVLVQTPRGPLVDIAASLARLQATENPAPAADAMRAHHAEAKGEHLPGYNRPSTAQQPHQQPQQPAGNPAQTPQEAPQDAPRLPADPTAIAMAAKAATARKLAAQADLAQMERDQRRGQLIARDDILRDLRTAVVTLYGELLPLAETLPPLLVPERAEQPRARALITDAIMDGLRRAAERIGGALPPLTDSQTGEPGQPANHAFISPRAREHLAALRATLIGDHQP